MWRDLRNRFRRLLGKASPVSEMPAPEQGGEIGLKHGWVVGEQLPWKGINFEVSRVEQKVLELIPIGLTWKRAKQIQEAKGK